MNPPFRSIRVLRAALVSAVLILLALSLAPSAEAQTSDLEDARAELEAIGGRIDAAVLQQDALDAELRALLGQIRSRELEVWAVQTDLAATSERVAGIEAGISSAQEALDHRAAQVYMTPPIGAIEVVLGTGSIGEAEDVLYFLSRTIESDADLILHLGSERTRLEWERDRLHALEAESRVALGRLDDLAAELGAKLAMQREVIDTLGLERGQAEALVDSLGQEIEDPAPPPPDPDPSPDPPLPPDPGPEAVKAFIAQYFGPMGQETVDVALCVAQKESGFDPHAENPFTGAAGVYQFIPSTWSSLAEAAGWGGFSVFDAEANVAVAAWTVEHSGWHHWPVAEACGA